jgi:phosphoribosylformimino-5-aminoimidazole carboxamide ribotide isomerase
MIIIPAIDILNGNIVRLQKGDYNNSKIYHKDPAQMIQEFVKHGFKNIHIVDLSGSRSGLTGIHELLKKITSIPGALVQFGGGIRTLRDAQILMEEGIDKLVIGSLSVLNKSEFEKIISFAGPAKIITAIDFRNGLIRIKGWTENTNMSVEQHISYCLSTGVNNFLCTDINKDGMLSGPNLKFYKQIMNLFPEMKLIASGGVSNIIDINEMKQSGFYGVVVGKALLENKVNLKELSEIAG